jgi:hypothetical protein
MPVCMWGLDFDRLFFGGTLGACLHQNPIKNLLNRQFTPEIGCPQALFFLPGPALITA